MIQVTSHMRILVAVEPQDFRRRIDGLCRVCREVLDCDPMSGSVFVFRSKKGSTIRLLSYDGQGFYLLEKRLSHGKFRHWPRRDGDVRCELLAHQLQVLLAGGDPETSRAAPLWRPIPMPAMAPPR